MHCHKESITALSFYNFDATTAERILGLISNNNAVMPGEEWYAGDHSMFAFKGIPCIAVTSSNLYETVLDITHTIHDVIENIDCNLIQSSAHFLSDLIEKYSLYLK